MNAAQLLYLQICFLFNWTFILLLEGIYRRFTCGGRPETTNLFRSVEIDIVVSYEVRNKEICCFKKINCRERTAWFPS